MYVFMAGASILIRVIVRPLGSAGGRRPPPVQGEGCLGAESAQKGGQLRALRCGVRPTPSKPKSSAVSCG